jgi:hypothetical protein
VTIEIAWAGPPIWPVSFHDAAFKKRKHFHERVSRFVGLEVGGPEQVVGFANASAKGFADDPKKCVAEWHRDGIDSHQLDEVNGLVNAPSPAIAQVLTIRRGIAVGCWRDQAQMPMTGELLQGENSHRSKAGNRGRARSLWPGPSHGLWCPNRNLTRGIFPQGSGMIISKHTALIVSVKLRRTPVPNEPLLMRSLVIRTLAGTELSRQAGVCWRFGGCSRRCRRLRACS